MKSLCGRVRFFHFKHLLKPSARCSEYTLHHRAWSLFSPSPAENKEKFLEGNVKGTSAEVPFTRILLQKSELNSTLYVKQKMCCNKMQHMKNALPIIAATQVFFSKAIYENRAYIFAGTKILPLKRILNSCCHFSIPQERK